MTQFYDEILAPSGLKVTQFSILRAIQRCGSLSITALAEEVGLDRTTMGKNLQVLERDGLVAFSQGEDRRERSVHITTAGEQAAAFALPLWKHAQETLTATLGEEQLTQLTSLLSHLSAVQS
jgi:DNA-binding MarR family transcriptional regulator